MGCIYRLTAPSGKSYIGMTAKSAAARWAKHVEHALGKRETGALYAALRKYGPERFTITTLLIADDVEYLRAMERAAIQRFGTHYPTGYNIALGGEGVSGPRSEIARINISKAQTLRFTRADQRALLLANLAKAQEACHRKWEGKPRWKKPTRPRLTTAAKSRLAKAALARPEVRTKVMACAAARAASPTWRAAISASKLGRKLGPCSDARKRKIADARRREWRDPVIRAKRLVALAKARAARMVHVET